MLSFYQKSVQDGYFTPISSPEPAAWIHAEMADSKDLQFICDLIKFQVSDLTDALDYHELPRVDLVQDCLIFFARYPTDPQNETSPGHLHTLPLTILLAPPYFITISPSKSPLIQEILQKKDSIHLPYTPSKILLLILKRIANEFSAQIKRVRNSVMTQGKEMNAVDSEDIFRLTEQEEILNQYLSSLIHFNRSLDHLGKINNTLFHKKEHKELYETIISIKQSDNICSFLIKNIRSLRDSYQIIFANKLTRTIKLLTALTILFSVPTMIASIYGMNVSLPFASKEYAFSGLLIFMFISSLLCGYWFYRKKWM